MFVAVGGVEERGELTAIGVWAKTDVVDANNLVNVVEVVKRSLERSRVRETVLATRLVYLGATKTMPACLFALEQDVDSRLHQGLESR